MTAIPFAAWTPATNTIEAPRVVPRVPLTEQPTLALHLLDLPPAVEPTRRDRISQTLRRALIVLVAVDLAGLLYVAATQL